MKNTLTKKHAWIMIVGFTILGVIAYIWLPEYSILRTILFGVAVSHTLIVLVVLFFGWATIPKQLKKRISKGKDN